MDDSIKNKAYLEALKLKNAGFEEEIIYARLEKQGIPEELARQAARNVMIHRVQEIKATAKESYNIAIIKIAIGVALAIISYLIVPGIVIVPIGFILTGIVLAFKSKSRM